MSYFRGRQLASPAPRRARFAGGRARKIGHYRFIDWGGKKKAPTVIIGREADQDARRLRLFIPTSCVTILPDT